MALSIKHPEADQLARELARETGETLTEAVLLALRERLERERGRRANRGLHEEVARMQERIARLGKALLVFHAPQDLIVGIEAVLPGGRIVQSKITPRRSAGPDIASLMIGSEGTLGVVTAVALRVTPIIDNRVDLALKLLADPRAGSSPDAESARTRLPTYSSFTEREREILGLLSRRLSNKEIARVTLLSGNTVKYHLKNVFTKLGVGSRLEAYAAIIRLGLTATADP